MDEEDFDMKADVVVLPTSSTTTAKTDDNKQTGKTDEHVDDVICDFDSLLNIYEPFPQQETKKEKVVTDTKPKFKPTNKKKKKKKGAKLNISAKFHDDGDMGDEYAAF
jgi:hypothetical protein